MLKWLLSDPKPDPFRQPTPQADVDLLDPEAMAEYRAVAKEVGVSDAAMEIEDFRLFLAKHDLPIFNRAEVVRYMDAIASKDNPMHFGWHWCPVRQKDAQIGFTFGTASNHHQHDVVEQGTTRSTFQRSPATDYYHDKIIPYTRIMPLNALKKILLIEKAFAPDKVRFLVTDFVLVPHTVTRTEKVIPVPLPPPPRINPDPFLMAVIPNPDVKHGVGTFVIDVWDEPGFGLEQRMKPA